MCPSKGGSFGGKSTKPKTKNDFIGKKSLSGKGNNTRPETVLISIGIPGRKLSRGEVSSISTSISKTKSVKALQDIKDHPSLHKLDSFKVDADDSRPYHRLFLSRGGTGKREVTSREEPPSTSLPKKGSGQTKSSSTLILKSKKGKLLAKLEKENQKLKERLNLLEKGLSSVSQALSDKRGKEKEIPLFKEDRQVKTSTTIYHQDTPSLTPRREQESPLKGHALKVQRNILLETQKASLEQDPIQTLIELMEASLGSFHSMLDTMEQKEESRRRLQRERGLRLLGK
jgi:hypothetical protein